MSYLLGFPTPIVEIYLGLIVLFILVSVYFGLRFEGTRDLRDREPSNGEITREVND